MGRLLITVVLLGAAAAAQIRGVPPSVTSQVPAPDGRALPRGVPPSATSLGPEGFGPPLAGAKIHRGVVPLLFPAFFPVPYVVVERERVIEREIRTEVVPEELRERPRRRAQREEPRDLEARAEELEELEPERPRAAAPEPLRESAPTVLVFRNGSRSEVRNYAIVGDALFVFAPDPTRKLLLADLDLDATRTANEARGLSFVLP